MSNTKIDQLKKQIDDLNHTLLELEQEELDAKLLEAGLLPETLERYKTEDQQTFEKAEAFAKRFNAYQPDFFGYPGNLTIDSPLVSKLRSLEAQLFYVNNAGDPFEQGHNTMDGKAYEQKLIRLFFQRFGLDPQTSWGYVTSGGSESNHWAIRAAYAKFEKARFYFSEAAHYSIEKALSLPNKTLYPYTKIPVVSTRHEAIDVIRLLKEISHNYQVHQEVPLLLLTWGTTKMGSLDDVKAITEALIKTNIPYYCHVDAAFFGGIPANQIEAPVCPSLDDLHADSMAISFHKFFGVPNINSILLSRHKADGQMIDYIGHHDTTVSGSRSFPIFSATQRIKEVLERSPKDFYIKNVRWMEEGLRRHGLPYHRDGLSNIFVIPKPSQAILEKYHLATFAGQSKAITCAHFIVNPFHTIDDLHRLLDDLVEDHHSNPQNLDL